MGSADDFLDAIKKMQNDSRSKLGGRFQGANLSPEQLYEQIFGFPPLGGRAKQPQDPPNQYNGYWRNLADMNRDLAARREQVRKGRPIKPAVNADVRRKQIHDELDIIRGRVPTPAGYKVDPLRVKELMRELKSLG